MTDMNRLRDEMYSNFNISYKGNKNRKAILADTAFVVFKENLGKMSSPEMLNQVKYELGMNFIMWWFVKQFVFQVITYLFNQYFKVENDGVN